MNSQSPIVKVFVYGTLKPGESNYKNYCQGKTITEIKAYTRGQLYHLPFGYPGMTEGNQKIEGYLLSFNEPNILIDLDRLENYQETRSAKLNDYYRQQVPIYNLYDEFIDRAWCYFMTKEKVTEFGGELLKDNCWYGKQ